MLKAFFKKGKIEVGTDEAGRGCLAGPVVAAAVIWDERLDFSKINDSKKLTKIKRNELCDYIKLKSIAWAVAFIDNEKIDKINILNASFLAMHESLNGIKNPFDLILVDGNRFKPYKEVAFECVVKGDAKYVSIAAASILAKTARDKYMEAQAKIHPEYGWETSMGYPTVKHKLAIQEHGLTSLHRKTFKMSMTPKQLKMF